MEHKKQKKRADSAFDRGYNRGYRSGERDAYDEGYTKGATRRFFRNDVPAVLGIGAVGAISSHYNLVGQAEDYLGDAWKYVQGLPSQAKNIICGQDATDVAGCITKIKDIKVDNKLIAVLTVAGISLAYYIYTQVRGTPEEKAAVNRKLRMARRMTEETSDKRIKRRQTNKIRHLTKSFGSEGVSEGSSEGLSESVSEGMSNSMTESSSSRSRRSRRTRRLR